MTIKNFKIAMPFTGVLYKEVEAETKEQALEIFYNEVTINDIEQWDCCEQILEGNMFYGIQNKMEIEEEEINQ